jgi:GTP-binding protein YchF
MKIGIIGFPQTGKKTLFGLLTNYKPTEKDLSSNQAIHSIAEIKDPRFDELVAIYNPKKKARARIEIDVLPKLEKERMAAGDSFKDIEDVDAVCHVVRAFKDESIYHVSGSVDSKRDIDEVNSELILHDLIFIEKRLERIEKDIKRNDEKAVKEKALLLRLKSFLDKELPLRLADVSPEEKKMISSYPFMTAKEMIIVLNVSDDKLKDTKLIDELKKNYADIRVDMMQVSAKVEKEIADFQSDEEKKLFLDELGIQEPAINILTRLCSKALKLMSFFTVGEDEVKQWTIKLGSSAPEAAGAIHSDLQKGFIRAELMKYNDLISLGNEEKVKEAGKFYLKGKDYIVEDGDIMSIRSGI